MKNKNLLNALAFLLLAFTCVIVPVQGQTGAPPDCQWFGMVTGTGAVPLTNGFDNRNTQCVTWTVSYTATGFSALTLALQSSTGEASPTSFGAYTGSLVVGSSGFGTNTTGGIATYTNLQTGTIVNTPWVRVNVSAVTGSGTIQVYVYGYRTGATGGTGGGGGSGGGVTSDVNLKQVNGTTVITGGLAGTQGVGGTVAVGGAAGNPLGTGFRDDAGNVLADYGFPDQAAFSLSAATDVVMVAGAMSTKTYVGHVSFSLSVAQTVTIQQGTGVMCGTNTVVLYGPAANLTSIALDYDSKGALHTSVAASDLCLHLGGAATGGGGIVYGTR